MNNLNLQDQMLKAYIDKTFNKYDTDRSGTLDEDQLTFFFNDLFQELNIGITVTKEQSLEAIRSIDQNSDGSLDKKELFDAFKKMLNCSPPPPPQYPPQFPNYGPYSSPSQYQYIPPKYPNQNFNNYQPPSQQPLGSYSGYANNSYPPVNNFNNDSMQYGVNNPYINCAPQYPNYNQYPNQAPYNNYQPPTNYNGYPPYNPYMNNSNSYMGGSTGNRWGRKQ